MNSRDDSAKRIFSIGYDHTVFTRSELLFVYPTDHDI